MPRYESGRIHMRHYTTAEWTALDPVLGEGEPGYDEDTHALKIGDGHTKWSELADYAGPAGPEGSQGPAGQDGAMSLTLADDSLVNEGTATNPKLKVGDLSDVYASAAQLQSLSDQQGQLMAVAMTTDENTVSQGFVDDVTTNIYFPVWTAPYACKVTAADLTAAADVAADATNYVRVQLRNTTNGSDWDNIVQKDTSDEAITKRAAWSFAGATWDENLAVLAPGQTLGIAIIPNGTATLTGPWSITFTVQST